MIIVDLLTAIKYYPNPATNIVNVFINQKSSVRISDLNGKILYQNSEVFPGKMEIDISGIENGVYLLVLKNRFESKTERLVIRR